MVVTLIWPQWKTLLSQCLFHALRSRLTRYRRAMDGYNHYLDQYMQSPQGPDGKRLTHVQIARWKLMGAAPAFCEAFTQQPPEALNRARACLAYMQVRVCTVLRAV